MIHQKLEQFIDARKTATTKSTNVDFPELLESVPFSNENQIASTIICQGDAVGCIVIPTCDSEEAMALAKAGAVLLGKQMEA